jgi:oligoendopeptidase F
MSYTDIYPPNYTAQITSIPRSYLPQDWKLTDWESLEPFLKELLERPLTSKWELEHWLRDLSELEAVIGEDAAWRQIRMTCDTENKELEQAFTYFVTEIQPKVQPYSDKLNKKLVENEYTKELTEEGYKVYLRNVKKNIELFREENIPLQSEVAVLAQHYGVIAGKMTVHVNGQEYTLQQAAKFLENPDRKLREEVYFKIQERRYQDKEQLNELFTKLVKLRDQIGKNAGFANYRDYKFADLGRFDYTKEDTFQFHESVKEHVVPLVRKIYLHKKQKLNLDDLRPWDTEVEPEGTQPLAPFENGKELLDKTIECFIRLRPFFGDCLRTMNKMKHLDLESRAGKAPGGYNMPLAESGAPFIFMNAAGQMHDVTTMVHEGGHAIQSFLTHSLELNSFKEYPMEIAEVASMSMELFSMDHWDVFFDNKQDLKRAKEHQLERVITIFPWIAIVDKFQHWIYENPKHTAEERSRRWTEIFFEFSEGVIDYSGLEKYVENAWQKQLHLFEVPFYYIEYGIAQLGAIGLWMQYKKDPEKALDNYVNALSLGATKTLPELYRAAGLQFDFSSANIKTLMDFVNDEMEKLK